MSSMNTTLYLNKLNKPHKVLTSALTHNFYYSDENHILLFRQVQNLQEQDLKPWQFLMVYSLFAGNFTPLSIYRPKIHGNSETCFKMVKNILIHYRCISGFGSMCPNHWPMFLIHVSANRGNFGPTESLKRCGTHNKNINAYWLETNDEFKSETILNTH